MVSLPSAVCTVSSLQPVALSGAPHSSALMWACSLQITALNERARVEMLMTLAPVPLKTI